MDIGHCDLDPCDSCYNKKLGFDSDGNFIEDQKDSNRNDDYDDDDNETSESEIVKKSLLILYMKI